MLKFVPFRQGRPPGCFFLVSATLPVSTPYLDFTQNPGKVMDDITFVRSH